MDQASFLVHDEKYDYFACIYGRRGQGKSKLLQRLAVSWRRWPIVYFDPLEEHIHRPGVDWMFRPVEDPYHGAIEAAKVAYAVGEGVNPDPELPPRRAVLFLADEIDSAVPHNNPNGVPNAVVQLAKYGRHRGVNLALAARRPPDIPPRLAGQASDIFSFKQRNPDDLLYFKKIGIPPEMLLRLPKHAFVHLPPEGAPHVHHSPWDWCPEGLIR